MMREAREQCLPSTSETIRMAVLHDVLVGGRNGLFLIGLSLVPYADPIALI